MLGNLPTQLRNEHLILNLVIFGPVTIGGGNKLILLTKRQNGRKKFPLT